MSQGVTTSIMVIMVIVMVGLGIYIMDLMDNEEPNKTGSCSGPDLNAYYKYNDDGDCVFDECKSDYFLHNGICMKSVDLSSMSNATASNAATDCTIDGYSFGQCKNTDNGQILTGDPDNCGEGTKDKYPNIIYGATGGGTCEDITQVECTVPCRSVCTAPDSLWVADDNAECRAIKDGETVVLGAAGGYCGNGRRITKLKDSDFSDDILGTMNLEEYKTSINFSSCEPEKVEACSVSCEDTELVDVGCPTSNDSFEWVAHNEGTVYDTEDAQAVLNMELKLSEAQELPAITRDDAINSGALTMGGVVDESQLLMGKKIFFKEIEQGSDNCKIFKLEDAYAPRVKTNCNSKEIESECKNVGCGELLQKTITKTRWIPEWGNGECNLSEQTTESCEGQFAPDC